MLKIRLRLLIKVIAVSEQSYFENCGTVPLNYIHLAYIHVYYGFSSIGQMHDVAN